MLIPKKIIKESLIHLVHLSSPVWREDLKYFKNSLKILKDLFNNTHTFDVKQDELDPRYLAGSKHERLRQFILAIKKVDWLFPVSGGTGCGDVVRELTAEHRALLKKNRPVVIGFSDTTFLLTYLQFKLDLLTFYYTNADTLAFPKNYDLLLNIIQGNTHSFSFCEPTYRWLTPDVPQHPIVGVALGGNLEIFRDALEISNIKPESWRQYILFIEDRDVDLEDYHRVLIALDERGIFRQIRALVIGRINEPKLALEFKRLNKIFGRGDQYDHHHLTEYLLSDVLKERREKNDPLYMLKVENFGHGVMKNRMIVPLGGTTKIYPDKTIEFVGPFVQ